jgi:DNA-binding CsgD family transcriptional regulator/tetratricopeptide (TPR) repeat protein
MRQLESRSFVGRAAELAVLEQVLAGPPAVALIGGEAGVGKTRLVGEVAARARARGAAVATGACVGLTAGTAPYLAVTGVLRDLGRVLPERAWERLRAGAGAEVAALLPGGARGGEDARADEASRARLFAQTHDLLADAAAATPLVIVLEDVHWADRSTLDLAGYLARTLTDERIVLLGTFRTDEAARRPALRTWLAELGRVAAVRRLELEPFTAAEVADLCRAILGTQATAATAAAIARRSGGNAFLAEELLAAGGDDDLPASIRDVLDTRIAALGPAAQELVRAAAVAGASADDELLAAIVPAGRDLAAPLREAIDHHVLVADARDGRLRFRHDLAREAVYAALLPGERRRLHAACARALSERPALGGDGTAAAVAGHWLAAGEDRHALAAAVRAAMAAEAVHASAEAAELYEQALALWDRVADAQAAAAASRLELLERAAEAVLHAGDPTRALALLDAALALADAAEDPVRAGMLHTRWAWNSWAAGVAGPHTYEHHDAALRLIPPEPTTSARAHAVIHLAYTEMLNARFEAARTNAREGVELARHVADRRLESLALNALGIALGPLGEPEEAIACLREAVAIAREVGRAEELGRAYVNLSAVLDVAGRLEESAVVAGEGAAACSRRGLSRFWGAFLTGNQVEALITLGRWEEAAALLASVSAQDSAGVARAHLTVQHARLELWRGNGAACAERLDHAKTLGTRGHSAELDATVAIITAELALACGCPDDARAAVAAGLVRMEDDARAHAGLVAAGIAVEACAHERGDERAGARARELIDRLEQLGPGAHVPVAVAEAATARAELTRLGRPHPPSWRTAAAAWESRPAPYKVAYARRREAEALLAAGADRAEAAEPLLAAAATARELGAAGLLCDIERLAARAGIRLGDERAQPELGLTPREREVLTYVAAGRTNRQIGEALYISPRTAGVHVARILRKLNATTRGEAAAAGRLAGVVDDSDLEALLSRPTG